MKTLLAILISLTAVSCATKHVPSPLPHVKIQRAKIVEEATGVQRSVDGVADSNGKIKGQIVAAVRKGDSTIESGKELEAEFARLVSKEAITRAELATANKMWGKYFRDVQVMQKEVIRASDMVNEQAEIINSLRLGTTNLMVEAAATDEKLTTSIQQSEAYASRNQELFDERDKNLASLAKQAAQIGRLRAFAIWGGGLIAICVLWKLVKLYLRLRP